MNVNPLAREEALVEALTVELHTAPRRKSRHVKVCYVCEVCTCEVVQVWAHGSVVSAPLESPDVCGESVRM